MGGKSWKPEDGPKKKPGVEKPELVRNPAPAKPAEEHLPMVPLSGDKTGTYETAAAGGSATSFFAIPGTSKRDEPAPKPARPSPGPVAAGPIAGPTPVAGPVPVGPQPVAGIAGPVASAGVGPAPGMGMPGAGFDPHAIQESRSSSNRVFAVVALLVMIVCFALVVSVGLLVFAFVQSQKTEQLEIPSEPIASRDRPEPMVDTGLNVKSAKPKPAPAGRPKPVRPRPTAPRPASGTTAAAPKPAPAPAGPVGGTVTVTKPADQFYTGIEVRCGAGFRTRANFQGNTATVPDVPAEACKLSFKGGAATPAIKFTGARSFRCTGVGAAMQCN